MKKRGDCFDYERDTGFSKPLGFEDLSDEMQHQVELEDRELKRFKEQ